MAFKLDMHTHILPPEWPDLKQRYGYGGWLRVEHSSLDSTKAALFKDDAIFKPLKRWCRKTELKWGPKKGD
ncbi:2-amino-3-carboxymuconate-6-semialdehyde decarboxylase [Trichonephila inaurata madagascariensis]|uniref:2-amino-3-carboxymuconate-6-semialdehyde decarboxylase n=1 Tax=Trichonephila inaurata madagascariensis TaxID=2747483 RepID=A0A8X6YBG6_9ARAC|nr:2-amino-3-carboxymuconate-6-semialdehyde decarboxylase [Trichonephila inaurata madagascariensis]